MSVVGEYAYDCTQIKTTGFDHLSYLNHKNKNPEQSGHVNGQRVC